MSNRWLKRSQIKGMDFCYYVPKREFDGTYTTRVPAISYYQGFIYQDVNFDRDFLYCVIRNGEFYNVKEDRWKSKDRM